MSKGALAGEWLPETATRPPSRLARRADTSLWGGRTPARPAQPFAGSADVKTSEGSISPPKIGIASGLYMAVSQKKR